MKREIEPNQFIHQLLMKVIPWKIWNWQMTGRLMRWNYYWNKEEFDQLLIDNKKARENWFVSME